MSILNLVYDKPKTIEELKDYCNRNGYDAHRTRFFIGIDYKEPKAFGIYKNEETGEFVVYKNKDNGARAIRYQGPDEEFAVSELYDRLQAEIVNQKDHYYSNSRSSYQSEYGGDSRSNNPDMDYLNRDSFSDESYSSDSADYKAAMAMFKAFLIIVFVFVLVFAISSGSSRGHRSGGSHYSSYDNYHHYNDYDSGWSSDNWDSGYTDWGSDW